MPVEIRRWNGTTWDLLDTAPPEPVSPDTGQVVGFIGDSLTYQNGLGCLANGGTGRDVRDSLVTLGFSENSQVDGLIGRSITSAGPTPLTEDVVSSWRSGGFDPEFWIMALGSNNIGATDQQWTTWITRVLDIIAQGPRSSYTVYWVGITFRPDLNDSRSTRFMTVLNNIASARADKITVVPVDFDGLMHNGRDETGLWVESDTSGRHMTSSGYALRNQIISTAVSA